MKQSTDIELGLDADSVAKAAQRIAKLAHRTPVMTSRTLDELYGAQLYFKCENLQRTGAFKIRGAANAVATLPVAQAPRGVATHSSGNHGAALACAAAASGIDCHVVVPEGAVASKVANIQRYGGKVIECAPTQAAREAGLADTVQRTGATAIVPYDDPRIIAGQGTIALELLEQVPDLDAIITPLGGGGMLSGCALWAAHKNSNTQLFGAEPAGADDGYRSLKLGKIVDDHIPDTLCDGLRAKIGVLNFALISRHVSALLPVEDPDSVRAMGEIMMTMKQVVEPSSSIALAAVGANRERFTGQKVGVVLSGGNVDLSDLPF